jgi:hypothetical protein
MPKDHVYEVVEKLIEALKRSDEKSFLMYYHITDDGVGSVELYSSKDCFGPLEDMLATIVQLSQAKNAH